jgi:DNA-binding NtrC family response regulator
VHSPTSFSRPQDETTQHDADAWRKEQLDQAWGIFWVSPQERFDELHHGATLGRSPECSFVLDGPGLSRRHARIEREGPLMVLRDLESKNGSFLNGQRRERFPLSLEDTLRIGDWVGVVCHMPRSKVVRRELFSELGSDLILSAPTLARLTELTQLARSDVSIIIEGETGTGKEVLAREVHRQSGRRGPLLTINCAAIPESLAEAQLFGHKKGAFTGALEASRGDIAGADGGTLFLDEIVELPLVVQSKLLRTLEERTVTPVGSSQPISVDFRLVASCQQSLSVLVQAGEFRADLYARLNGAELKLPPLRERRQEVLHLLRRFMHRRLGTLPSLGSRLVERLCSYPWPYNVRELCQLARLLAASGRTSYGPEDLPERFNELETPRVCSDPAEAVLDRRHVWLQRHAAELDRLERALQACGGNVSEAARQAGVPRHRARRLLTAASGLVER